MAFPNIQTAIPLKRYQYGEYGVTVLGDIESKDVAEYKYLMAFVKEGESAPVVFVSSELSPTDKRSEGRYQLRVINSTMDEVMSVDDVWAQLEGFCEQGLNIGSQLLGLDDDEAYPLG